MKKVLIIAEAGVNHNGDISVAKKLIDAAALAGADIVKFQTFKAENLVTRNAKKADYQIENTKSNDSQFDMLKKLELSHEDHVTLINYCKERNISFLSTAFDMDSLDFLISLKIDIFKVPSGEITNYLYLKKIGAQKANVILSTGMSNEMEIGEALKVLIANGTLENSITILQCNTEYPTPMEDVNLNAMKSMRSKFKVNVGYSDHTLGIEVPIAAVALGATVIEKHFTLDKKMEGPDHVASIEPGELKKMVEAIRNIEKALGSEIKTVSPSEEKNRSIVRKSIYTKVILKKGHAICEDDLVMKRPGSGISPMEIDNIIGKKIKSDLLADHLLEWEDLEN